MSAKLALLGLLIAAHGAPAVKQWEICEISLDAAAAHANPYQQQDTPLLTVTFVHAPSRREWKVEGFWDGGRAWKIRLAPPLPGVWRWRSASPDSGLNNRAGDLAVAAPSHAAGKDVKLLDPRSGTERGLGTPLAIQPPDDQDWVCLVGDDHAVRR